MVIRPAGAHDEFALLALRNEPTVRFWSSAPAEITEARHREWFGEALSHPDRVVLVADDGGLVGYGRLERHTYVSFAVQRGARGYGYGKELLTGLEAEARWRRLPALYAHVHPGNGPSLGAFGASGYEMRDVVQVVRKVLR